MCYYFPDKKIITTVIIFQLRRPGNLIGSEYLDGIHRIHQMLSSPGMLVDLLMHQITLDPIHSVQEILICKEKDVVL